MKFLVLGAGGMAGHVVAGHLREAGHTVETVARSRSQVSPTFLLDVRDVDALNQIVRDGAYDVVVNCVGLLIQPSEQNPADAAFVNGYLPHHLAETLAASSTRLFHLSTDCVFSGQSGPYAEHSPYDGQRLYDRSKALGEVQNDKDLTLRMSIIGPELGASGTGLFDWFARQQGQVQGFTGALWNGITTTELARCVELLAGDEISGLIHLVPQASLTKCELLQQLNGVFDHGLDVEPVSGYQVDKRLSCTRTDLPCDVASYEHMLADMRSWMELHASSYPHYDHLLTG